jgi:hypothetical protein
VRAKAIDARAMSDRQRSSPASLTGPPPVGPFAVRMHRWACILVAHNSELRCPSFPLSARSISEIPLVRLSSRLAE